jgi:chitodextrinase
MRRRARCVRLLSCAFLVLALAACGGSGSPLGGLQSKEQAGPPGLPAFPGAGVPQGAGRAAAAYDNTLLGRESWLTSSTGATVNGDSLVLASAAGQMAWAIYAWGEFADGIVPLELRLQLEPVAPNKFWLLLSDYDAGKWELHGPLDGSTTSFTFSPSVNYISPTRYTYAALAVAGGNGVTIDSITLVCDQDLRFPAAPRNLTCTDLQATRATLAWTPNSELDLHHYNVYSGPADGFSLSDLGVTLLGTAGKMQATYLATNLTPETDYHFRVTAVDTAGNESKLSNTVNVTTPVLPVQDPPTNLRVTDFSSIWADVAWDAPVGTPPVGYEVYTGLNADFQIGDARVVKRHTGLVAQTSFHITGLFGSTEYFVRVRAYGTAGVWSVLCDAAGFTTKGSVPPVPNFTYSQEGSDYLQAGLPVAFDPSSTTDEDTPLDSIQFTWDFDGDGAGDITTIGPAVVVHTYPARAHVPVSLTAYDGVGVVVVKTVEICFRYGYWATADATGQPAMGLSVDADPVTGHLAFLRDGKRIELYDGANWSEVDATGSIDFLPALVRLTPTGLALLGIDQTPDIVVQLARYDGASWTTTSMSAIGGQVGWVLPSLAVAPNGRLSASLTTVYAPDLGGNISKACFAWHENADGTFAASRGTDYRDGTQPMPTGVERTNDTTYFVWCQPGQLMLRTITDSGYGEVQVQSFSSTMVRMFTGQVPTDGTQLYWVLQSKGSRIYYGDNYGAPNGATQAYSVPSSSRLALLGATLAGDNQAEFYWKADDVNGVQHLRGYNTSASEAYEFLSGYQAVAGGTGTETADGGAPAVYLATDEQRDGDFEGRLIQHGTVLRTDVLTQPDGAADIQARHAALAFPDGGILCLSSQVFPIARESYTTAAGQGWSVGDLGVDSFCVPSMACLTGAAGEFLVGGYDVWNGTLVLDHYGSGNPVALHEEAFTGTAFAQLGYNQTLGSLVAYATGGKQNLAVRTWSGTAWSDQQVVYSGAAKIRALGVASNPLGRWGVLLYDDSDTLSLFEYDGTTWQGPVALSSVPLNDLAGIGCDYNAAGDLCVAVERTGGSGINAGLRPAGGSITWAAASPTPGKVARSLRAFYHLGEPVIVFYYYDNPQDLSKVRIVDQISGFWRTAAIPEQIHGDPIGMAVDASGDIVLAGFDWSSRPSHACSAILYK